ncbi:MAG: hypothetical protein AABZ36_06745 [Nitrospirota bacterium]
MLLYIHNLQRKALPATLLVICAAMFLACSRSSLVTGSKEQPVPAEKKQYVENEIIVKFKNSIAHSRIKEINTSLGCEIIRGIGSEKTFLIKINTGEEVKVIMGKYKKLEEIEYAEPNYIKQIH